MLTIQRLVFLGLAVWDFVQTRDVSRAAALVVIGQTDLKRVKAVAFRVLTTLVAKAIETEEDNL